MGFKANDKVVCVYDGPWECTETGAYLPIDSHDPKKGCIYTVDGYDDDNNIYIAEVTNIGIDGKRDSYETACFRKVEPKKQTNKLSAKLLEEFKESQIIKEVDIIVQPAPINC